MPLNRSCILSERQLERKERPEYSLAKIKPAHIVSGYNSLGVVGDKAGSVMSMSCFLV